MAQNKNQHYVPKFYFKLFSKNQKTICLFNIPNEKFIEHAPIVGQCSKDYFYSKNIKTEKVFSKLEGQTKERLKRIIDNQNLTCLFDKEKEYLKSDILFQRGRTKFAFDKENDMANYMFDILKPKIYEYAKESGENISWESIKKTKIASSPRYSLLIDMMSGILLYDLKMVLLENKSKTDFIFSDNPVVFFNSFFNRKHPYGTTGLASTGLQIFYPVNSELMLFLFDPIFYDTYDSDIIKVDKNKDVQRLNGLQIINCDNNIYFGDKIQKDKIIERYSQLKFKKPKNKNEYEIILGRVVEYGTYNEIIRTSSPKIHYNIEKLSFLRHKNTVLGYGVRNPQIVEIHKKLLNLLFDGKVKSMDDLNKFLKENSEY